MQSAASPAQRSAASRLRVCQLRQVGVVETANNVPVADAPRVFGWHDREHREIWLIKRPLEPDLRGGSFKKYLRPYSSRHEKKRVLAYAGEGRGYHWFIYAPAVLWLRLVKEQMLVGGDDTLGACLDLTENGDDNEIDIQIIDESGSPVEFIDLAIDVSVTLRAKLSHAPEQPPERVGQFTRTIRFDDSSVAMLTVTLDDASGFRADDHESQVETLISAAAYPGLQSTTTTITLPEGT